MSMSSYVAEWFRSHPHYTLRALGAKVNVPALDLEPFGQRIDFLDAAAHPKWIEHYHRSNIEAFPGPLSLPGWVLVDFYLLPGAIGLLTCDAKHLPVAHRRALGLKEGQEAIAAAYYATPCVEPGTVMGCSLFSFVPLSGAARMIKAITLRMLHARKQRGVAQWGNRSLWVHTRMGVLRLDGPVPASHGKAAESFVYTIDLTDESRWLDALRGVRETERFEPEQTKPQNRPQSRPQEKPQPRWIDVHALGELGDLLERARKGERIEILPPGLSSDEQRVFVRAWDR